jgi:hypothetical protein
LFFHTLTAQSAASVTQVALHEAQKLRTTAPLTVAGAAGVQVQLLSWTVCPAVPLAGLYSK